MSQARSVLTDAEMACAMNESQLPFAIPRGISEREAALLLGALARVKARRFGRLVVTISDARIVDVEVIEKMDRDALRTLSM